MRRLLLPLAVRARAPSHLGAACDGSISPAVPAEVALRARGADVALGSRPASAWTFDGRLPGRELRMRKG